MAKSVDDVQQDAGISDLLSSAKLVKDRYVTELSVLEDRMLAWLRERMPVGAIISTRPDKSNPRPPYLCNVTVMRGNARGTHKFRVERVRSVEPNVDHPGLSRWNCDVTPISETTGKDMSPVSGNSRHQAKAEFVSLRGYFDID